MKLTRTQWTALNILRDGVCCSGPKTDESTRVISWQTAQSLVAIGLVQNRFDWDQYVLTDFCIEMLKKRDAEQSAGVQDPPLFE